MNAYPAVEFCPEITKDPPRLLVRSLNLVGCSRRIGFRFAPVLLAVATLLLGLVTPSRAQKQSGDLTQKSLEDLMNIGVTSVSKKEQKTSQVAAAIFVISQDDIQRSGALNIPDLLRMVPGLDVAQIDAGKWAISARGINGQYSNQLLVLVDGRTVYTPIFGGVFWDSQNTPLKTIERIEVIRGPGAAVWGANAVNGVINIITKNAEETQGVSITAREVQPKRGRRQSASVEKQAGLEAIAFMRRVFTCIVCPARLASTARTIGV